MDGEAFLILSDDDIRRIVEAIGPQAKLLRLRNDIQQKTVNAEVSVIKF